MLKKFEILNNKSIRCFYEEVVTDGEGISIRQLKVVLVLPTDDMSGLPDEVQAVCAAVHTPEVIEAYQANLAQSESAA